ncbi:MAG: hypothetical protein Q7S92_05345 [Candidatus Diapherotrites archaeon]|nr:hypothetical protein [Candidatus Diapherotrites archaeon]
MNLKKNNFLLIALIAIIVSGCTSSSPGTSTGAQGTGVNGVQDCGADGACFSAAAANCTPVKVTLTFSVDFLGILSTTTNYLELSKKEGITCKYYQRTESQVVKLSDEIKQQLLSSGKTEAEIEQQESELQTSANQVIGLETSCRFETAKLVELLRNWQAGNFSTDDLSEPNCVEGNVDVSLEQVQAAAVAEENKCLISSDCSEGFHCFKKECINNEVIESKSACEAEVCTGSTCEFNVCQQTCPNCEDGKLSCMMSSNPVIDKKCVECFMDSMCATGFECKAYECVAK